MESQGKRQVKIIYNDKFKTYFVIPLNRHKFQRYALGQFNAVDYTLDYVKAWVNNSQLELVEG